MKPLLPVVIMVGALVLSTGVASAKRVTPETEYQFGLPLVDTSVSCSITNLSGATRCAGPFQGNDSNSTLDDVFGSGEWLEIVKVDGGATKNGLSVIGGTSGTWSFTGSLGDYSAVMVALKGGPSFSLYELEAGVTSGTWDTLGIVKGNGKASPGLSHFTLYGREKSGGFGPSDPVLPPVPLPAPVLGLLAGLGGLAALRRGRRKA